MRLRVLTSSLLTMMLFATAAAKAGGAAELPRWRIQVRAYGPEQSSFVAIHHRITALSELGLQLDGSISNSKNEQGVKYDDATDRSGYEFALRPEYRRWFVRDDRLSTFWGCNVMIGARASDTDQQRIDSTYESRTDEDDFRLGAGVTVGADLELLDHLSIAMVVCPVALAHVWTSRKATRGYPDALQTTKTRYRNLSLDFNLTPALYACIRF